MHLVGTAQPGGTEKQLLMLLAFLDRTRFEPHVALIRGGPLVSRFAELAPVTVLGKDRAVDLRFLLRLRRTIRTVDPAIVSTWLPTANLWGTLGVLGTRNRLLQNLRHTDDEKQRTRVLVDRLFVRRADVVACNAQAIASVARTRGIPAGKLRVVYNGVSEGAPPQANARHPNRFLLLGRLDPTKGHDVALRALSAVPGAHLDIAGGAVLPVEESFAEQLRELVRDLRIGDRVRFLDHVKEPSSLIDSAVAVVSASLSEGLPNVVLEAMARGAPVIATRAGGTPEIVIDGDTGWLVPTGDAMALAAAMREVLAAPAEAGRRAARGQSSVAERFSPERMVADFSEIYDELLGLLS